MNTPESDFSDYKDVSKETPHPPTVAWANVLDCRYGIEVVRTREYEGMFRIYDLDDNNKLLHEQETKISYDAKFGPDVNDVMDWQDIGIQVIDGKKE